MPCCVYRCRAGPLLLDSVVHQDVGSERHLVHVDVVGLDAFVLLLQYEQNLFPVIPWMLLRHSSPRPDGSMAQFHKTKASWIS